MAWLRDHTDRKAAVCADARTSGYVPAIALRRVVPADAPAVYRDEAVEGARAAPGCSFRLFHDALDPGPSRSVPAASSSGLDEPNLFRSGAAVVRRPAASPAASVTSFDKDSGNPP
jgi:hypothetical protein